MENRKGPACGSCQIGQGLLSGYANMTVCNSKGKATMRSSPVRAEVCASCGLVISLHADKPEKFMPKEQ